MDPIVVSILKCKINDRQVETGRSSTERGNYLPKVKFIKTITTKKMMSKQYFNSRTSSVQHT